ncbi:hypothetical protein Scep_021305 [Stephania cephalantha]|uniref:Uncharacterized protein n=1 Tax=Stephania cephalantha TaxID=152367 RepID=A0AAP0I1B1_9MAGN
MTVATTERAATTPRRRRRQQRSSAGGAGNNVEQRSGGALPDRSILDETTTVDKILLTFTYLGSSFLCLTECRSTVQQGEGSIARCSQHRAGIAEPGADSCYCHISDGGSWYYYVHLYSNICCEDVALTYIDGRRQMVRSLLEDLGGAQLITEEPNLSRRSPALQSKMGREASGDANDGADIRKPMTGGCGRVRATAICAARDSDGRRRARPSQRLGGAAGRRSSPAADDGSSEWRRQRQATRSSSRGGESDSGRAVARRHGSSGAVNGVVQQRGGALPGRSILDETTTVDKVSRLRRSSTTR